MVDVKTGAMINALSMITSVAIFGHAGICFSLNLIVVTELSVLTISGMNAVSNINLSSRYVHRDV